MDGAAALVKNRGNENFSTPLACMMFLFIRRNTVSECSSPLYPINSENCFKIQSHVQTSTPVDPIFEDRDDFLSPYENVEDRLHSKTMLIPQLQAWASSILSQSSWDLEEDTVSEVLRTAEDLDFELTGWAFWASTQWSYSTIVRIKSNEPSSSHDSNFIPGEIHRYPNIYVARIWNLYRVSRLIIQSIISRVSTLSTTICNGNQTRIDAVNQSMVSQICASIPFLLGYDCSELKHSSSPPPNSLWPQYLPNKPRESNNTGKFSLIWPLYVASSVESLPEVQRNWLREQLSWIAGTGEAHAQVLKECKSQTLMGKPEAFRFDCV